MKLLFQKLSPTARIPEKGSARAAGFDLFADLGIGEEIVLFPGRRQLIPTGIAVATPPDTYFRVAPRSGHANSNGIDVLAGVIDEDYRGNVGVILLNTGSVQFTVKHGTKIAQGIVEMIAPIDEVEVVAALPSTDRGEGGFGSTGH